MLPDKHQREGRSERARGRSKRVSEKYREVAEYQELRRWEKGRSQQRGSADAQKGGGSVEVRCGEGGGRDRGH